jgi:predicted ester cyclase
VSTEERNKALTLRGFEEMFNRGDLSVVDELVAKRGEDHQEAPGTDFAEHLKDVIEKMRAAFPDLRFEVHHLLAEGDMVAARSTMTGTRGALRDRAFSGHRADRQAGRVEAHALLPLGEWQEHGPVAHHGHARLDAPAAGRARAHGHADLRG